jgi:hypothetical protein
VTQKIKEASTNVGMLCGFAAVVPYLDLCPEARKLFLWIKEFFIIIANFVAGTFESSWAMWMFLS